MTDKMAWLVAWRLGSRLLAKCFWISWFGLNLAPRDAKMSRGVARVNIYIYIYILKYIYIYIYIYMYLLSNCSEGQYLHSKLTLLLRFRQLVLEVVGCNRFKKHKVAPRATLLITVSRPAPPEQVREYLMQWAAQKT